MSQGFTQYEGELVDRKRVYYTGADQLTMGYVLCFDADLGTAGDFERTRAMHVEKPTAANAKNFAGVVAPESSGKTGPAYIDLFVPIARGQKVNIFTDASVTVDVTNLYVQPGSYAAGAAGVVYIGRAMQTVDRSTTNGTAQTLLTGPSIDAEAAQSVGASTTFTAAIWQNFPVDAMRANPALGTFVEFEPFKSAAGTPPFSKFAGTNNSVTADVKAASLAETDQIVLSHDTSTADNDAVSLQMPGPIVLTGGKPWALEISFDLTTVTDADMETFIGLAGLSTLSNVIPYQDGGAFTAALDLLGINVVVGDGNAMDVSYQATGETTVVHDVGALVPVANTAIRVGFYYNGTTIAIYADGTSTGDPILAADISDLTDVFPAGITTYLTVAGKGDSGVADGDDINIRAIRMAQLA